MISTSNPVSNWFGDVVKPTLRPEIDNNIWRCDREDKDHFDAEYLDPATLKILELAESVGWREAVERASAQLDEHAAAFTRDYFLATYRASFVDELALAPGMNVLDIGCGWGFSSQRCLEKGANVVGVDGAIKRLQFCSTRFEQERVNERFVGVQLDVNRSFPFNDETFDVIIVSGVLEWLPCSTSGDPFRIQDRFMKRVYQLLKQGGRFYLAIENRYWGPYFRGAADLHMLRPWLSILPRKLARAYSILRYGEDYRAFCYSLTDYLNWFGQLGYASVSVSYPDPDYIQPKSVMELISRMGLNRERRLRRREVMGRATQRRLARFGRSFMFFADK